MPHVCLTASLLFVASVFSLCPARADESTDRRVFIDTKGRNLRASILDADETTVILRTENGRKHVVPRTRLSEADQTFIRKWQTAQRAVPEALEVRPSSDDLFKTARVTVKVKGGQGRTYANFSVRAFSPANGTAVILSARGREPRQNIGLSARDAGRLVFETAESSPSAQRRTWASTAVG